MKALRRVSIAIAIAVAFCGHASAEEACQGGSDAPQDSIYEVYKLAPDGTKTLLGVATAIDENGFLLTAGHIATSRTSQEEKLIVRSPQDEFFEVSEVAAKSQVDEADWALLKLKRDAAAPAVPALSAVHFSVPETFGYQTTGASIYTPRGGTPIRISDARVIPYQNSRFANPSDYLVCPTGHRIFVKTDSRYTYGDSGSPILDQCNRLMGITSGFAGEPYKDAKDYLRLWAELTASLEIAAKATPGAEVIEVQGDAIENVNVTDGMSATARAEAEGRVRVRWRQLMEAYSNAQYISITPVSCLMNDIAGRLDEDPRGLQSAGPDKDALQDAITAMRRGLFTPETLELLDNRNVSLIDLSRLVTATRRLKPASAQEFEAGFTKFVAQYEAMPLYLDYRQYALGRVYKSYSAYVSTARNFIWRNQEQTRQIERFFQLNAGASNLVSPNVTDDELRSSAVLIEEGQKKLSLIPAPAVAQEAYALTMDQVSALDSAILDLATGALKLRSPAKSSHSERKYAAQAFSDLALALQFRRRFKSQDSFPVKDRLLLSEMKAAKIALLYNYRSVLAWDVASRSFFDRGSTAEAWYLAGIAMHARCAKSCKVKLRGGDKYADNLYSNIKGFYEDIAATGYEEDLIEIVQDATEKRIDLAEAEKLKTLWAIERTSSRVRGETISQCVFCPAVPVIDNTKDELDVSVINSFDVVNVSSLSDWVTIWPGSP